MRNSSKTMDFRASHGILFSLCVLLGLSASLAATSTSKTIAHGGYLTDAWEVVRDSASAYEVRRTSARGLTQHFLCEQVEQNEGRAKWTVHLASGTGDELSAWVLVAPGRIVVTGTANDAPFTFLAERISDALLHDVRVFGDVRFDATFNALDAADPRNRESAEALLSFANSVSGDSAWRAVEQFGALAPQMLARSSSPDRIRFIGGNIAGAIGGAIVPWSIDSYMKCLREACANDGGCWSSTGCHACAGDYWYVKTFSAILYLVDAEICFVQHILNPITW